MRVRDLGSLQRSLRAGIDHLALDSPDVDTAVRDGKHTAC